MDETSKNFDIIRYCVIARLLIEVLIKVNKFNREPTAETVVLLNTVNALDSRRGFEYVRGLTECKKHLESNEIFKLSKINGRYCKRA